MWLNEVQSLVSKPVLLVYYSLTVMLQRVAMEMWTCFIYHKFLPMFYLKNRECITVCMRSLCLINKKHICADASVVSSGIVLLDTTIVLLDTIVCLGQSLPQATD